jgi:hypothetical protein
MRCERLHAIIPVSQCLENQKPDRKVYAHCIDKSKERPKVPNCWKCPTGKAARRGELNDDDIEVMKQRILNGMRGSGLFHHPAERENNVGGLNTGVTMEMKRNAKANASRITEQRNPNKTSERVDTDEILEEIKHKTAKKVFEEIMQDNSKNLGMVEPVVEEIQEQHQVEDLTPKDGQESECVCEDCGEAFETYKRGSTIVKRICLPCLNAKIGKSNSGPRLSRQSQQSPPEAAAQQTTPTQDHCVVSLDFTAYRELFSALADSAVNDFRTPAMQALFLIKQALENHHAVA